MASPIRSPTPLDELKFVETWIRCFATQARAKKLKDHKFAGEEHKVKYIFFASAGCVTIRKISVMADARELEGLTFSQISDIILRKLRPKKKLVIVQMTKKREKYQRKG